MATEIVLQHWCDICLRDKDTRVDATFSEDLGIGGVVRTLELCQEHAETLILTQLRAALDAYGSPATGTEVKPSPHQDDVAYRTCPVCQKRFDKRGTMRTHIRDSHGTTISALTGKRLRSSPTPCTVCGFEAKGAQGLGAHMRAAHGVLGPSAGAQRSREENGQGVDLGLGEPQPSLP